MEHRERERERMKEAERTENDVRGGNELGSRREGKWTGRRE